MARSWFDLLFPEVWSAQPQRSQHLGASLALPPVPGPVPLVYDPAWSRAWGSWEDFYTGTRQERLAQRQAELEAAAASAQPQSSPSPGPRSTVDQASVAQVNPKVAQWADLATAVASESGVPVEVILAIIDIESDGDPRATSPAGAMGLMQVMPFHWKPGEDPYDPEQNVRKGAQVLKANYDRIRRARPELSEDEAWALAAAAYFGAFDWNTLRVTGAQDALGTTGHRYVGLFDDLRGKYAAAVSSQGAASQPSLSGPLGSGLLPASSVTGGTSFPVTQPFGQTEFARTSGLYRGNTHPGYDLGVPLGTPVTAPLEGVVVQAGWNGGYGYSVTVQIPDGRFVLVGHLSQVTVSVGQRVAPGTVLGRSGTTGASTGPHLHLEVRDRNGVPVDPAVLFQF